MFDPEKANAEQLLLQASRMVEDAAFDLASSTSVDLVARLIVISAELQQLACRTDGEGGAQSARKRRYSDA